MQAMLLWALGKSAFGIAPARRLKSLLIQAENDEGDLAEMRDGVVNGMELQQEEAAAALANIVVCREDARTGAGFFALTVRPLLETHRPDILWIDPALAYLGSDTNSQQDVSAFLRNELNPLLHEFECAAVVVHHTNKPPKKNEGTGWTGTHLAYLGSGSSEWANWARAVLALRSTQAPGIFELSLGKRGGRLNWRAPDESMRVYSRYIAHAKGNGEIYWRPATEAEVESTVAGGKAVGTSDHGKVLLAIPTTGSVEKTHLVKSLKARNIGRDKALRLIDQLVEENRIHEIEVPRSNARAEIHLATGPAPEQANMESASQPPQQAAPPPSVPIMDKPVASPVRPCGQEAPQEEYCG